MSTAPTRRGPYIIPPEIMEIGTVTTQPALFDPTSPRLRRAGFRFKFAIPPPRRTRLTRLTGRLEKED